MNSTNHININKAQCDLERQEYNADIQNATATFTREFDIPIRM